MTTTRHLQNLADLAASLRPRFTPEKPLPRLLFVTDPARTPFPEAIAARLPAGAGVIFRHFGADDAAARAGRLRKIADTRGLVLLIGNDEGLAQACRADGVHLSERMVDRGHRLREGRPDWILTAAAHSLASTVLAMESGCDAALVSPVFVSNSRSAGAPMGAEAFAGLVKAAPLPVYALGGVNAQTARRLTASGAQGFAMVEGLAEAVRT